MNWDKMETTIYHRRDGKTGMLIGEIDDLLKGFLSPHILAENNQPVPRKIQVGAAVVCT